MRFFVHDKMAPKIKLMDGLFDGALSSHPNISRKILLTTPYRLWPVRRTNTCTSNCVRTKLFNGKKHVHINESVRW